MSNTKLREVALQKLKDGVECPHCKSRNIKYADTHHYANGHVTPIEVFICHDCGRSFPIEIDSNYMSLFRRE